MGIGGLMIGNIYPFRAKRPKHLRKWLKTQNQRANFYYINIAHVDQMAACADLVVCAWGCNYPGMPEWLEIPDLHYLELCKDGITPKHPLGNLSVDLKPKLITN